MKRRRSKRGLFAILAIVGVAATVGFSVHDTIKAKERIDQAQPETILETVKTAAPCYVGTFVSVLGTVGAIAFSHRLASKEIKTAIVGLGTAGGISASRLNSYRGEVRKEIGEEKEKTVWLQSMNGVDWARTTADPKCNSDKKKVLFIDQMTGKSFEGTKADFYESIYYFNRQLQQDFALSKVQWAECLNLRLSDKEIEAYEKEGWSIDYLAEQMGFEFYWIDFWLEEVDPRKYRIDTKGHTVAYIICTNCEPCSEALTDYGYEFDHV